MGHICPQSVSRSEEDSKMFSPLSKYPEFQLKVHPRHLEVVHYLQYGHTWKPLRRAQRRQMRVMATTQHQRGEVILRNLAQELLTNNECNDFKQALQHFRISKSVPTLCTQLKPVINTTEKLMLLLELSGKLPIQLQRDFHKLCSLQFSSYESFLKYFNTGNPLSDDPKVIAKDSSGQFQVVSTGFEKKMHVIPFDETNGTDGVSLPGTSVTSGIYSEMDDQSRNGTVTKEEAELIMNHSLMGSTKTPSHSRSHSQERSKTPSRVSMKSLQMSQKSEGHSRKSSTHSSYHLQPGRSPSSGPFLPQPEPEVNPTRRRVLLNRREDGSLGVGIKGGKEYGTAIVVYLVEANSQAEQQGLKVGDHITEVNGTDFSHLTHAEAVTLMRNAWNLIIEVETPQVQNGHPVIVPIQQPVRDTLDVVIFPTSDGKLGCAVYRDPIAGDIIVKDIEANSPAGKAGLKKGDCIMKIDGLSVNILSEKQIAGLTNAKRVKLSIKRSLFGKENNPLVKTRTDTIGSDDVFTPTELPSPRSRDVFFASSTPRNAQQTQSAQPTTWMTNGDAHHASAQPGTWMPNSNAHHVSAQSPTWMSNGDTHHGTRGYYISQRNDIDRSHVPTIYRKLNKNHYNPRQSTMPKMTMVYHSKPSIVPNERSRSVTRIKKQMLQYVRSRSQSPHSMRSAQSLTAEDHVVLHAVQSGIQKRQRALRLSLYQVADTNDDEWKI